MNEEITASAPLDVSSHLLAFKWTHRWVLARGIALMLMAVLCLSMAFHLCFENGKMDAQLFYPALIMSAASFFVGLGFVRAKSKFIEQTKAIPGYGEQLFWSFQDESYEARIGGSKSQVAWGHVSETKSTPDGILIYPQPLLWEWIPKHAFSTEADYTRFLTLVTTKTKHSQIG